MSSPIFFGVPMIQKIAAAIYLHFQLSVSHQT